jgi:hypothetical protein
MGEAMAVVLGDGDVVSEGDEGIGEGIEDRAGPSDSVGVAQTLKEMTAPGKNLPVRIVQSESDLLNLFGQLSRGGKKDPNLPPMYQIGVVLKDGTHIWLRDHFQTGGATIDIKYPNTTGKGVKVHIDRSGPTVPLALNLD